MTFELFHKTIKLGAWEISNPITKVGRVSEAGQNHIDVTEHKKKYPCLRIEKLRTPPDLDWSGLKGRKVTVIIKVHK